MIYIISLNTWKVDQTVREFVTVSDLTVFVASYDYKLDRNRLHAAL